MKIYAISLLTAFACTNAFSPLLLAMSKMHQYGSQGVVSRNPSLIQMADYDSLSLEEEVKLLAQEEINKGKQASNLHHANGVDYAPWMGINKDDEERIKQLTKDCASARRKPQDQEHDLSGALFSDRQEPSGTGPKTKIIDGDVELEWVTNSEKVTKKGFLVKRRPAKTSNFTIIASYNDWGPLQMKGVAFWIERAPPEVGCTGSVKLTLLERKVMYANA